MQTQSYDVVIVGSGMVGATLACALAQATSLSIAVLEARSIQNHWQRESYHHRVSAISLSSQRIFKSLGVWDAMQALRVSPFKQIHVWDQLEQSNITFDSQAIAEPILGYIIENNVIEQVLHDKMKTRPFVHFFSPVQLTEMQETENGITLKTAEGHEIRAKLVVGADGAKSWVRQKANIGLDGYSYEQTAIVATVKTASSHQQVASQVFLPTGPLAFLPLAEPNLSSIVWSLPSMQAKELMCLSENEFKLKLAEAFSYRLGDVTDVESRFTFPLAKQQAHQYVKSRIALVGDAAHTIHPMAGQGVNIGLLDAASLAEVIIDSVHKRRDFSSLYHLRRYERWRKADNLPMLSGVDKLKQLFATEKHSTRFIRGAGLSLVNHSNWIKNIFIRHAVGERDGLPTLATKVF